MRGIAVAALYAKQLVRRLISGATPVKSSSMGVQEQLQIGSRHEDGRVVLSLDGELDLATAELLEQAMDALPDEPMVVLDLERLKFIDSTGLRGVLAALERCRERGQEFAITPGSQQVQRLLGVTGVGKHLRIVAAGDEVAA
jgi:anti-sigma B factor antagonist